MSANSKAERNEPDSAPDSGTGPATGLNNAPSPSSPTVETWRVWRQDDHGNRFLVEGNLSAQAARELLARLESMQHKQAYWLSNEEQRPEGPPP